MQPVIIGNAVHYLELKYGALPFRVVRGGSDAN
jgi:hypothetical protein